MLVLVPEPVWKTSTGKCCIKFLSANSISVASHMALAVSSVIWFKDLFAVAAAALALTVGLSVFSIKKGLKNFKGVQRRFNKIFTFNKVDFFDDYAHHPTEIKNVLDGVKNVYKGYEKICIFQPHRISRLKDLKKEFTYAFKDADKVILLPIYTAGEKIRLGFKYENFAREIIKNSKVKLFLADDRFQLAKYIKNNIYGKKIVIGMGAGTISTWMREMPKYL